MEFDGKRALVTGSSGMGLASALRLARDGAEVHLCGIDAGLNAAAAEAARRARGGGPRLRHRRRGGAADGCSRSSAEPGFDILVNAAAIQTYGTIETTDPAHWDRVMAINLRAAYLTSHLLYPEMKARGGGAIVAFLLGAGLRQPAGRAGLRHHQGGAARDDPGDGGGLRPRRGAGELDQPRLDPDAAARGRRGAAGGPGGRSRTSSPASARRIRWAGSARRRRSRSWSPSSSPTAPASSPGRTTASTAG